MSKLFFILSWCFVFVFGMTTAVLATSMFDITFPIPELGDCADKSACKAYCDELVNANACAAFAKKHGLGSAKASEQAAALPNIGPGGCKSASECKNYCDNADHFDECIQFAESNGLLNKKEIKQARDAITKGPGGCRGIKECKAYCSEESNHLECADYAHRQGQISDGDYKAIKQIKGQGGPGGCRDNDECHAYCESEDHIDECLSFSENHGFISKEDAMAVRKAGFAGAGPGGCKGNDACRAFCQMPEHQSECVDFAEQKGFMSKEEAARARKFAGKTGPGGCRGDQCRTFCEDPANTEICLEFAEREGLLPKEEIERAHKFLKTAREGGGPGGCKNGKECQAYCKDKTHEQECFEFGRKQGLLRPEEEKQFKAGMDIRKKVEQNGGPGGCKGDDECRVYCTDPSHTEECIAFAAAHGGIDEQQARMMLQEFTTGKFSETGPSSFEDFQRNHENTTARFHEFKQLEEQFRGGDGQSGSSRGPRFGPPPGRFPGQQPGQGGGFGVNFGAGDKGFIGPGGCTGPAECIKYCSEHREECFSGGSQGQNDFQGQGQRDEGKEGDSSQFGRPQFDRPQFGRPQFGRPQFGQGFEGESHGGFMPQLRNDIVHEIKSEDLPEGFEGRSMEEKQQFFREKFQQFRGQGQEGSFPGAPSQGFPGDGSMRRPQFDQQGGNFRGPEFQGQPHNQTGGFDSFNGVGPKSGTQGIFAPLREGQQRPFNQQGNEPGFFGGQEGHDIQGGDAGTRGTMGQQIPSGGFRPPQDGQFMPPSNSGTFHPPQSGQFQPPSGEFRPPPSGTGTFQPPTGGTFQQFPTGNFPPPPNSGTFQQFPSSGTGSFQPPPPSGGTFQAPSGTTGGTFQQPSSDGSFGSMPPPPSGSTGGFQPPPPPPPSGSTGGFQPPPPPPPSGDTGTFQPPPPPPPSGRAPQYNFFASILNLLLGNY